MGAHVFEGTPAAIRSAYEADAEGRAWEPDREESAYRDAIFGSGPRGEEGVGQC